LLIFIVAEIVAALFGAALAVLVAALAVVVVVVVVAVGVGVVLGEVLGEVLGDVLGEVLGEVLVVKFSKLVFYIWFCRFSSPWLSNKNPKSIRSCLRLFSGSWLQSSLACH